MSVKDLKEYGKRCYEDPNLGARSKEIGYSHLDGQIEHGASLGLTFTKADFAKLTKGVEQMIAKLDPEYTELSEEELEEVASMVVTTTAALVGSAVVGAAAGVVGAGAAVAATTTGSGW